MRNVCVSLSSNFKEKFLRIRKHRERQTKLSKVARGSEGVRLSAIIIIAIGPPSRSKKQKERN